MRLRTRIIIAVVIACSIINLFLCFYFTEKIRALELSRLNERIEKSIYMMKLVNSRPLYNVDKETLKINMETFFKDENMQRISLLEPDTDITIVLEKKPAGKKGRRIHKSFKITYKNLELGKMDLVYSTALIEKRSSTFRIQMLLFTFSIIGLLVVVLIFLINRLMRPVTQLTQVASEIAMGNLDREIDDTGVGEVGKLARNFAAMRDSVKEKINDLAMTNRNLEKEIFLKEINEKKILRQSNVISAVNTFFQQSMLAGSYKEIARIFIPIALEVIPSKYCFVGEVQKEDQNFMDILAISENALNDCKIYGLNQQYQFKEQEITGIRSCVIHGDEAIISNDPAAHPDILNFPENHVPIDTFLGVPMKLGDELKGIIAMAGKEDGYDSDDKEACEMLAIALVEALSLKKREDEKARLEEMMVQSEKMVSIGGLAAGMAHEINNPLAGILQNVQVAMNRLKGDLPKNDQVAAECGIEFNKLMQYMEKREIYKLMDSVMDAGKRAAVIVSNMLSFSRKSSSGYLPENIAQLLDKTVELACSDYNLKKRFDFKRIGINRHYDETVPDVLCKASEIQQVFFNVLSNGAQAMMSGDRVEEPCFSLSVSRENGWVKIEIQDNGPGMKENVRKRVFEPFFTTKGVGEGTGLGLAVSYFIITESHKGSIEVDSGSGEGTSFIIRLPADNGRAKES